MWQFISPRDSLHLQTVRTRHPLRSMSGLTVDFRSCLNFVALQTLIYLSKLQRYINIWRSSYLVSSHTLNCFTATGVLTTFTCRARYELSLSTSIFALISPYSPPIFFGFELEDDISSQGKQESWRLGKKLASSCIPYPGF